MSSIRKPEATQAAAQIATALFAVASLMQVLIALGVIPITMAWGGRQSQLTDSLQIASLVSASLLLVFAYIIRRRASLAGNPPPSTIIKVLAWLITAFMVLNTLGNLTSLSLNEKLLFTPMTLVLAVACFVVSISEE